MVRLPRRRTLRRVFATGDDFRMDLRVHDLRVAGTVERPRQEVRNVVNPMAGCGVQQTRGQSNEWVFGSARCGGNR
jgi:hypothetical protein